jgi:hypothetical protein
MGKDVLGTVYETLLCSPGMNDAVKIDVKVSRKVVLLLNSVIEQGLTKDQGKEQNLLELVPAADIEELQRFSEDCLSKAGLKELSEKMKQL